jgi:hypothetical protein
VHTGLVRCAAAVLLLVICFPQAAKGVGQAAGALIFLEGPMSFGAGGYADYGVIAQHRLSLGAFGEWAQWYLAPIVGFVAAVVLLRGWSPRWLARAMKTIGGLGES